MKHMFRLVNFVKSENWEGVVIQDIQTKEKFITNGVYKWKCNDALLKKIKIVESIDIDSFLQKWERYYISCDIANLYKCS